MTTTIRPRRRTDLPALADVLLAQQATSRYPFRDPLPIPVDAFLHAEDAQAAWVAELDGAPVGHVCRTGPLSGFPGAEEMNAACAEAHGCAVAELSWVSTLFVGQDARGHGLGRRLLDTVVADIAAHGLHPCLEVLAVHPAALSLYESSGWRPVLRQRPGWLTEVAGDEGPDVLVMVLDVAGASSPRTSHPLDGPGAGPDPQRQPGGEAEER
ncbi:N-acetyltransferase family protein [Nocardioides sp. DS6]|uniref:N-acetyltransferase family protein n=1 Tax=Nocardioides eburneus TaxID=3231482 RepID=A0ABV3SZJ6_9ACTN